MIEPSDFAMRVLDIIEEQGAAPTTGIVLLQFEDGDKDGMVWAWEGNTYAALGMLFQAIRNIRNSLQTREDEEGENQ